MSYGAFVSASIDERRHESAAAQRLRADTDLAAKRLRRSMPDLNDGRPGVPCPWAVWAYVELLREHRGDVRRVNRRMILGRRAEKFARHKASHGHEPYALDETGRTASERKAVAA